MIFIVVNPGQIVLFDGNFIQKLFWGVARKCFKIPYKVGLIIVKVCMCNTC